MIRWQYNVMWNNVTDKVTRKVCEIRGVSKRKVWGFELPFKNPNQLIMNNHNQKKKKKLYKGTTNNKNDVGFKTFSAVLNTVNTCDFAKVTDVNTTRCLTLAIVSSIHVFVFIVKFIFSYCNDIDMKLFFIICRL